MGRYVKEDDEPPFDIQIAWYTLDHHRARGRCGRCREGWCPVVVVAVARIRAWRKAKRA
ncbi:hypothetical protein GCM10027186_56540 [Micromonospora schwarzwaldensis]